MWGLVMLFLDNPYFSDYLIYNENPRRNKMDKTLKILFGGLIAAATLMFLLIAVSVDAHDYRHSDHHYMNQGHHMRYFDGNDCPMYKSDEYRDLIEKQRKEREEFLKKQEAKRKGGVK
jgi:hypothetical protein